MLPPLPAPPDETLLDPAPPLSPFRSIVEPLFICETLPVLPLTNCVPAAPPAPTITVKLSPGVTAKVP